jgi:hypothetical protein
MSDTAWGLAEARPSRQTETAGRTNERPAEGRPDAQDTTSGTSAKDKTGTARLSPQVAASAHSGIVWLHLSAIVVWLLIAAVFGAVAASGRELPVVVFVATLGAAAGHALFLGVHAVFGAAARRRQATIGAPARVEGA